MRASIVIATAILAACTSPTQAVAEPVAYEIDGSHSHIVWDVDRFGFAKTVGSFPGISGTLVFDEAAPENSSVEAVINVTGVRSDLSEREDVIKSPFWLNADAFPTITFASTEVSVVEGQTANVTGNLTLLGETLPVTLSVTLNKSGADPVTKRGAIGFSATGNLNRSDFGLSTALGPVGDAVNIRIEALAIAVK